MTGAGGAGGGRTLSRDYKNVKRVKPGGGAQSFSGWMGLAVGLSVGLSVALAVFLHYRGQPAAEPTPEPKTAPRSDVATEDAVPPDAPPGNPGDQLTFYDILKDQEVEVPAGTTAKPGAPRTVMPKGEVTLQAGSFKQQAEAEKMIAKLAVLGIDAKIQRFPMDDETWYRVRIGPISTAQQFEGIKSKLVEADIPVTAVSPATAEVPPP